MIRNDLQGKYIELVVQYTSHNSKPFADTPGSKHLLSYASSDGIPNGWPPAGLSACKAPPIYHLSYFKLPLSPLLLNAYQIGKRSTDDWSSLPEVVLLANIPADKRRDSLDTKHLVAIGGAIRAESKFAIPVMLQQANIADEEEHDESRANFLTHLRSEWSGKDKAEPSLIKTQRNSHRKMHKAGANNQ